MAWASDLQQPAGSGAFDLIENVINDTGVVLNSGDVVFIHPTKDTDDEYYAWALPSLTKELAAYNPIVGVVDVSSVAIGSKFNVVKYKKTKTITGIGLDYNEDDLIWYLPGQTPLWSNSILDTDTGVVLGRVKDVLSYGVYTVEFNPKWAGEYIYNNVVQIAKTTSLIPKVYKDTNFVNAKADIQGNVADAILLSDGSYVSCERVVYINHPYTVGNYYYLSQTVAGGVTIVPPTSGLVQQLFFVKNNKELLINVKTALEIDNYNNPTSIYSKGEIVENALSSLNFTGVFAVSTDGNGNVTVYSPEGIEYANMVHFNSDVPSTATIFSLTYPPTENNPTLAQNSKNLYIGNNYSTWLWKDTQYGRTNIQTSTSWDILGTSVDAGRNTNSIIQRYADTVINGVRVGRGGGNINTNTVIGGGGAMASNTIGDNNVAMGEYALGSNTTGSSNFGLGFASLGNNKIGGFNVAVGRASLRWSTGSYNLGFGMQSFSGTNLNGNENIGIGWLTGSSSTLGASRNVFIGSRAGYTNTTGSNNLALGANASLPSPTASNQLSIKNSLFAINTSSFNPLAPVGFWGVNIPEPLSSLDIGGSIGVNIRYTSIATSFTDTDYTIVATSNVLITLPAPIKRRVVVVKALNTDATISGIINGTTPSTLVITNGQSRVLQSDGSTWLIIGGYL